MIKRTLYFGNPAYLCFKNGQIEFRNPEIEKNEELSSEEKKQYSISFEKAACKENWFNYQGGTQ